MTTLEDYLIMLKGKLEDVIDDSRGIEINHPAYDYHQHLISALSFFVRLGERLKKENVVAMEKVLLDTCEKELDVTMGFMLTEQEANIFAQAIITYLTQEK